MQLIQQAINSTIVPPRLLWLEEPQSWANLRSVPDHQHLAIRRALLGIAEGAPGGLHERDAVMHGIARHGLFEARTLPPEHAHLFPNQGELQTSVAYLRAIFARAASLSGFASGWEQSTVTYLQDAGMMPGPDDVWKPCQALQDGFVLLVGQRALPELRVYAERYIGGEHGDLPAMLQSAFLFFLRKQYPHYYFEDLFCAVHAGSLAQRFRRSEARDSGPTVIPGEVLERTLSRAKMDERRIRLLSPFRGVIAADVGLLRDIMLHDGAQPSEKIYAPILADHLYRHVRMKRAQEVKRFLLSDVVLPGLDDAHSAVVARAADIIVRLRKRNVFSDAMERAGRRISYPVLASPSYGIDRYVSAYGDPFARATASWFYDDVLGKQLVVDRRHKDVSVLDVLQPMHSLADYQPDPSLRKPTMQGYIEELRALTALAEPEQRRALKAYLERKNPVEALDIGEGPYLIIQGHHRLSALVMAASQGIIPRDWLTSLPIRVLSISALWPKALLRRILTRGVPLTWQDLFPRGTLSAVS